MLDAVREAKTFIAGRTRKDLTQNQLLALGLVRLIEIIGEASSQVSEETRSTIPTIPWPLVISMRNRLTHGYFDVDLDPVWDTIVDDLPPVIAVLENVTNAT